MHAEVRTRIAPSPTGPFHTGTARSALFNFVWARKFGGAFLLRIEDTDRLRSESRWEDDIRSGLEWLGLRWDEFSRQSERLDRYEHHLRALHDAGAVYWCPHTADELSAERHAQEKAKAASVHRCEFREAGRVSEGEGVFRFKNTTDGEITFSDIIRGDIRTRSDLVGDFSVAKNFHEPLYNFAVVVDDHEMAISHVIRGEDHISNTPKQILLQEALGFARPAYAHLPLVLGRDRSKLSKRHGPASLSEYRAQGYLPEAMINFMALLGWHPEDEREIFSMDELIRAFALERVQKAGAIFDIEKLNFLNREHIRRMPTDELEEKLRDYVRLPAGEAENAEKWKKVVELARDRLTRLSDISEIAAPFYHFRWEGVMSGSSDWNELRWRGTQSISAARTHLEYVLGLLQELDENEWTQEKIKETVMPYASQQGKGEVLWPLRMTLLGQRDSPDPFEIAETLGKSETRRRLDSVISNLRAFS